MYAAARYIILEGLRGIPGCEDEMQAWDFFDVGFG